MNAKRFDSLHPSHQKAFMLGMAASVLGRDYVVVAGKKLAPAIKDNIGHGFPVGPYCATQDRDPKNNFWNGAWRIHDLG